MYERKFQAVEIDISADLAARLIAEQFPQWENLPVRPVRSQGTWCVNYRLGVEMVIRLPRVAAGGGLGPVLEHGMLARLAPTLPRRLPPPGRPLAPIRCPLTRRVSTPSRSCRRRRAGFPLVSRKP